MVLALERRITSIFFVAAGMVSVGWGALNAPPSRNDTDARVQAIAASESLALRAPQAAAEKICEAEAIARDLVRERPFEPVTLVRYAGMLEIADAHCDSSRSGEIARPEIDKIVALALQRSPYHRGVLLAAAVLAHREGASSALTDQRLSFLRRAIVTPGIFTDQERYIFAQELDTPETVKAVVPAQMREVLFASQVLARKGSSGGEPFGSHALRAVLAELQIHALGNEQHFDDETLRQFARMAADGAVSARIDQIRAGASGRTASDARTEFFSTRAALRKLPTVTGVLYNDSHPETGTVVIWRRDEPVVFDKNGTSVVSAVAAGTAVRAVQLASREPTAALDADEVRVFVSSDNANWKPVTVEASQSLLVDDETVLFLTFPHSVVAGFVKIHFAVPVQRERFSASIDQLMHVYGEVSR